MRSSTTKLREVMHGVSTAFQAVASRPAGSTPVSRSMIRQNYQHG